MKLIDFDKQPELSALLNLMGAKLVRLQTGSSWESINDDKLSEILATGEVEVSIEELEGIDLVDGVFEYEGQRVIVYIRDQINKYYSSGYKFHFTKCSTISEAFTYKRDSRYVLSMRTDGQFIINLVDNGEIVKKGLVEPLNVCRNCLRADDYQGYSTATRERKDQIYDRFDLNEFFKKNKKGDLNRRDFRRSDEW